MSDDLESRMRKRLAEMETEVKRIDDKEESDPESVSCEEYEVRDSLSGAIDEFKDLLGITEEAH
ncbi:MAG: hypothetical protein LUQ71_10440 [Methanoregula sp.]|nr:hypothetical protein [Methanoregula sp.]